MAQVRHASPPPTAREFQVPAAAQARLDTWGPAMRSKIERARSEWLRSLVPEFRGSKHWRLRVGTDCSGADAPVWALRALQVPHEHVFSCDNSADAEKFITACSPPKVFFHDMLRRPLAQVPDVDLYVCGFPCTPFSSLRGHSSKLFKEAAAKPYFAMLKVLREKRPRLAILENVVGLGRVMSKVLRDLQRLRWYHVLAMRIDPKDGCQFPYRVLARANSEGDTPPASPNRRPAYSSKFPSRGTGTEVGNERTSASR